MFSWVAIERAAEEMRARDRKFRKKTEGHPFRSAAKYLTDAEILDKLRSLSVELDRQSLGRLVDQALSAQEIASRLMEQCDSEITSKLESDWIWICVDALWRRWFPNEPFFEKLDDRMQAGYERQKSLDKAGACRVWLEAWDDVLHLLDKGGIQSISEFDERFRGTQCLFNWIQELELELWNAGLKDRQFLQARVSFCEEGLRRFNDEGLLTENRRRALAESYFELGEACTADALFREWLKADPRWGGGWIGWSDCYEFTRTEMKSMQRCEEILLEGFSVPNVTDLSDIGERLADLYQDQGRNEEADEIRQRAERPSATIGFSGESHAGDDVSRQKTSAFAGDGPALREAERSSDLARAPSLRTDRGNKKIGRNSLCPCGSGIKFKKCCGARKQTA